MRLTGKRDVSRTSPPSAPDASAPDDGSGPEFLPEPLVADYFAGIGLMSLGLRQAGWKTVFATDVSPEKRDICRAISPEIARCCHVCNVFDLKPACVPRATLAACSFPCTDLSLAGHMRGSHNGRQSNAFLGFLSVLQEQGTSALPVVLVENVPGWLHSRDGEDFKFSVRALNACGYACDVFAMNARHFVPQSRLRIFLPGVRHNPYPASASVVRQRSPKLCPPPGACPADT